MTELKSERVLEQSLVLLSIVRILVRVNRKVAAKLLWDFLTDSSYLIKMMLEYLHGPSKDQVLALNL